MTSLPPQESCNNLPDLEVTSLTWGDDPVTYEPWVVGVISSARVLLAVLGFLGNAVTIRTFIRIGISDPVNLTLAWLAASDICFLVSGVAGSVALTFNAAEMIDRGLLFPVDPRAIYVVVANIGSASYTNTVMITTFVTVARCLVVAEPLRFRNVLSWKTSAILMAAMTCLSVTTMILLLVYVRVLPQYDPGVGSVRPTIWFSPQRKTVKDVIFGLRDALLPLASQICVNACVFIMARSLKKASNFRRIYKTRREPKVKKTSIVLKVPVALRSDVKSSTKKIADVSHDSPTETRLAGQEMQIVRQILIIASVYSVCNMPKVIVNIIELSVPGFYIGQRYHAWYNIAQVGRDFCQTLNATATFWIYWHFNSQFRKHCLHIVVK